MIEMRPGGNAIVVRPSTSNAPVVRPTDATPDADDD